MPRKAQRGTEIRLKGFLKFALTDVRTGEVRESPWYENVITQYGFEKYICGTAGSIAGSSLFSALALATQSAAVNSTASAPTGEFGGRKATTNSFVANGTLRGTASWNTDEATASTINCIAVFGNTTASNGSCGSLATVNSSNKTTNQTLNVTYEWRFT